MRLNGLLNFIVSSEKRCGIMLLLLDNPKTFIELRSYFDVTAPELIPRIRELENKNLGNKEDNKYHLTPLAKSSELYIYNLNPTLFDSLNYVWINMMAIIVMIIVAFSISYIKFIRMDI